MNRRNFLENVTLLTGGTSLLNTIPDYSASDRSQTSSEDKKLLEIRVTAPSVVRLNEPFWVGIRLLTEPFFADWIPTWQRTRATVHGPFNKSARGIHYIENVLPSWKGAVTISGDEGFSGIDQYSFTEGNGPYQSDNRPVRRLEGFQFTSPGVKYIRVTDPVSGVTGISNAIYVEAEKPTHRLFWGNLHCHSIFGDGIRIPEEIYAFARDESFLDIFALTDHTEAITDAQWNYFKEVTNDFDKPGRFVTFIGGEWTSPKYGHRNYIYPTQHGPILRCTDPDQDTLPKIHAIARKTGALIIANHTASPGHTTDWDNGHDPEVERLVEIYSIGGINEMMFGFGNPSKNRAKDKEVRGSHAIDGLKRGFKLGFIGTGDDHDGRPGDSLHHLQKEPDSYRFLRGPGLMGVWAEDLSRESVFRALWNRRVYGTTNNRTLVKFSVNGHPMGSEIVAKGELQLSVEVASNLPIQRIELIKEGEVVQSVEPGRLDARWDVTEKKPSANTWYYVRVSMANEHIAWSSPVWISPG
jgi:hypothetical protein